MVWILLERSHGLAAAWRWLLRGSESKARPPNTEIMNAAPSMIRS